MKKLIPAGGLLILTGILATACGPSDPELKGYAKMKPEEIRAMKNNYDARMKECEGTRNDLKAAEFRGDSLQRLYNNASAKLKLAEREVSTAREEVELASMGMAKGVIFKVQIGAFKGFDIKKKIDDDFGMSAMKESGFDKYFVGTFKSYNEASEFRKDLVKLGLKDAFVVAFQDGKKISVDQARKMTEKPAPAPAATPGKK